MQKVRLWIALAVVTLFATVAGISEEARAAQPSDVIVAELAFGSVGGGVGAIGGGFIGILLWAVSPYFSECVTRSKGHLYGDFGTCLFSSWMLVGAMTGNLLGATIGVILTGEIYQVQGNVPLALLSAMLAEAAGIFVIPNSLDLEKKLLVLNVLTAVGATIGYNIGAKMKSDKSKPAALSWQLPLVAVRF